MAGDVQHSPTLVGRSVVTDAIGRPVARFGMRL
jgi:hypothetical protein